MNLSRVQPRTHKKAGETKFSEFFTDTEMTGSADADTDGWHVTNQEAAGTQTTVATPAGTVCDYQFRALFGNPCKQRRADLEFKIDVLSVLKWGSLSARPFAQSTTAAPGSDLYKDADE